MFTSSAVQEKGDRKFKYYYICDKEPEYGYIWEFVEEDEISDGVKNLFS